MINLIHGDCMEYMATLKDNEFDLAVVDPPYGIGNWIPDNVASQSKKQTVQFKQVEWNQHPPHGEIGPMFDDKLTKLIDVSDTVSYSIFFNSGHIF